MKNNGIFKSLEEATKYSSELNEMGLKTSINQLTMYNIIIHTEPQPKERQGGLFANRKLPQ